MVIIPTFLKWAGGKRRILMDLEKHFPNKVQNYFEPFLGAGSMFFYVKQKYNPKHCYISDINKDLIDAYKTVRSQPTQLIKELSKIKAQNSKSFYYRIRDDFNSGKVRGVERAAVFIYLNKSCFNGLYRVNSKNKFNVPYGKYSNPEIFREETIYLASKLLKGVDIKCQDYRKTITKIRKSDFVYLDPCYDPIKKTSFVQYTPKAFSSDDREELFGFIKNVSSIGANILLSNNNLKEIRKLYSKPKFNLFKIYVSRSINSVSASRGKIAELAITNY